MTALLALALASLPLPRQALATGRAIGQAQLAEDSPNTMDGSTRPSDDAPPPAGSAAGATSSPAATPGLSGSRPPRPGLTVPALSPGVLPAEDKPGTDEKAVKGAVMGGIGGILLGAAVGFAIGGPIGAGVGAALGLAFGIGLGAAAGKGHLP